MTKLNIYNLLDYNPTVRSLYLSIVYQILGMIVVVISNQKNYLKDNRSLVSVSFPSSFAYILLSTIALDPTPPGTIISFIFFNLVKKIKPYLTFLEPNS